MFRYRILKAVATGILRLLYRVKVVGVGNIPPTGGVILCANHIHLLDPVVMLLGTDRQIKFMAKTEIFSWPLIGSLARAAGAFPVKRGAADITAIKTSLRILQGGEVLGLFPEGTRAKEGEIKQPFQGVAMLAEKAQCLVVPAYIKGNYKIGTSLAIAFGEPIYIQDLSAPGNYDRGEATNNLMAQIHALRAKLP